jgi:glyoxylase-like metal-dependent hydrolase (beta-lactamase superfamily II)
VPLTIGLVAAALLSTIAAAAAWLVVLPPDVPSRSSFELRLPEVRRVALASRDPLPLRLNVIAVAESEKPLVGALGGFHRGGLRMPWTAFQIVYADSSLVVDAGADAGLHRERGARGSFHADRFAACQDALRRASAILFTHEHPDHVGGAARSPHLAELKERMLLTDEQLANTAALAESGLAEDVRAGLRPIPAERPLRVAPGVVLIRAPGHTPGSQIVYVRLANGRELLLVGDIAWHRRHFEEPRGHPRLSSWILGEDLPRVLAQLRALHEAWRDEGVVVVPSHDGAYLDELVAAGLLGSGFE